MNKSHTLPFTSKTHFILCCTYLVEHKRIGNGNTQEIETSLPKSMPKTLPLGTHWIHILCQQHNSADIPRIDNFTFKLSRDYFSKLPLIDNKTINSLAIVGPSPEDYKDSGYIPPQIFTYIDYHGLVQNENNFPLLCHWRGNKQINEFHSNLTTMPNNQLNSSVIRQSHHVTIMISIALIWKNTGGSPMNRHTSTNSRFGETKSSRSVLNLKPRLL